VLPQLRRGWRVARGLLFRRLRVLLFGALFIVVLPRPRFHPAKRTWQIGSAARGCFSALPHPAGGARRKIAPPAGAVVIASNHTSYLDGAVLLAVLPWRNNAFVAKRELREGFITRHSSSRGWAHSSSSASTCRRAPSSRRAGAGGQARRIAGSCSRRARW